MLRLWACLVAVVIMSMTAQAASLDEARQHYIEGRYEQALSSTQNLNDVEAYLLASEALSAQILLGQVRKPHKRAREAVRYAEDALKKDPNNMRARLQYALAYGLMTRSSGALKAWRKKYPVKSRDIILALKTDVPDNPRVEALLGAWHLGVVRKAGEKNAQKWYQANVAAGQAAYERALEVSPNDILILSQYAVSLLVVAPATHKAQVSDLLKTAITIEPVMAIDRLVQARMMSILEALSENDKTARKLAEDFLDSRPAIS